MGDWNTPTLSDLYTNFLTYMKARDVDALTLCVVDPTNIPESAFKYHRASDLFQERIAGAWVNKVIAIAGGGTGSVTASGARANLELGTMAVQNANAVSISGGSIAGTTDIDAARITSGFIAQIRLGSGSGGAGQKVLLDNQTWGVSVPVGSGFVWYTNSAPTGFLMCDGSAVSRTTYSDLFAVIGTTFGVGNGSTTFNVPDLRQRLPLGKAVSGTGSTLAATGGNIDHTHTETAHTHSIAVDGSHLHTVNSHVHTWGNVNTGGPSFNTLVNFGTEVEVGGSSHTHGLGLFGTTAESPLTDSQGTHSHGGITGPGTGGTTGANNPPYLVVNYIIKH